MIDKLILESTALIAVLNRLAYAVELHPCAKVSGHPHNSCKHTVKIKYQRISRFRQRRYMSKQRLTPESSTHLKQNSEKSTKLLVSRFEASLAVVKG